MPRRAVLYSHGMTQTPIRMYSTSWCSDCRAAKMALDKKGIAYQEINIEEQPDAAEYVMSVNGGKRSVPTLQYGDVAASLSGFSITKLNDFLGKAGLA
ncbi:NrdH-redoxin [Deinococcus aquiradiocola]|uniref:NrdH-redoxin n=2 Tax=Deinococcus aquiradiocola TaxID=393059 RepID=A0A917PLB0_9DEIO|nr:NrdH-redoxin [Deinococcus aquiradiocola]